MKLSRFGRISMALVVSVAVGLGMTACGGGTVGFMWVLGTQYNQIAGFKIDDYTGNLTNTVSSPYPSNGTNPVSIVVKTGGRFLYVVNKGSGGTAGNISLFTVGGDGNLIFQQAYTSAGTVPVWATMDSAGSFLYVLDQLDPTNAANSGITPTGGGDITVFASDPSTGRLSLVQNQQLKYTSGPLNGTLYSYFPVGKTPTMVNIGGSCVYSLNTADASLTAYSIGSSGQLLVPNGNSNIQVGLNPEGHMRTLTSINSGGGYVFITDATATAASPGGQILQYSVGNNCALNTVVGSPWNNLALTSNPVNSFVDSRGQHLYVLNRSTTNTSNTNSSISAFTLQSASNGLLQPVTDAANPYSVGSGPMCMVEDPTSKYLYTSNYVDGTVTGKFINVQTGQLSQLSRGSTFTATGLSTCLAVTGSVN